MFRYNLVTCERSINELNYTCAFSKLMKSDFPSNVEAMHNGLFKIYALFFSENYFYIISWILGSLRLPLWDIHYTYRISRKVAMLTSFLLKISTTIFVWKTNVWIYISLWGFKDFEIHFFSQLNFLKVFRVFIFIRNMTSNYYRWFFFQIFRF